MVVLAHQLRLELDAVNDAHLLEKRRLARLTSAQQKQFHLEVETKFAES